MEQQAPDHNPFMLMINPEVIFAAMEKSERLGQLNRHLCRPLDRMAPPAAGSATAVEATDDTDDNDDTIDKRRPRSLQWGA